MIINLYNSYYTILKDYSCLDVAVLGNYTDILKSLLLKSAQAKVWNDISHV